MAKLVVFRGRAHQLPNDSMKADPVPGIWFVGERPQHLPDAVSGFTEKVFDKALAEQCGRTCGPNCDGDCFAEMYADVGPDKHLSSWPTRQRVFECLPWPPETTPEPEPVPAPEPIPEPEKPPAKTKPTIPAATAAKE